MNQFRQFNRNLNRAKRLSFILMVFFGILGIGGLISTTFFYEPDAILYFIIFTLVCFWWSILFLFVYRKLSSVVWENTQINYKLYFAGFWVAFASIYFHSDFQIQRYTGIILFITNFHFQCGILYSLHTNADLDFQKNFHFTMYAFLVNFLFGAAFQIYLLYLLGYMFVDYKDYSSTAIYPIHLQQNQEEDLKYKNNIVFIAIAFCISLAFYHILKIILYSSALTSDEYLIISIIVILQSFSCLILCYLIVKQLNEIKNSIEDIQQHNFECFFGWFILVKAILFSQRHCFWRNIIIILQIVQVIYGLIQFPFFQIYSFVENQIYYEGSYIVWDTAVMTFFVFWRLCDSIARIFSKVKVKLVQFDSRNLNNPSASFVFSNDNNLLAQIELQTQVNQVDVQIADQDFGECCICLDKMTEGQQVSKLKCHELHIFHHPCIQQWRNAHNKCPLCQKTVQ